MDSKNDDTGSLEAEIKRHGAAILINITNGVYKNTCPILNKQATAEVLNILNELDNLDNIKFDQSTNAHLLAVKRRGQQLGDIIDKLSAV